MNRNWLVTAFFFALLLLILYGAFLVLSPFLTAITWALILAILFYPFYAWLLRLQYELRSWNDSDAVRWAANMQPMATYMSTRLVTYLKGLPQPVRT